MAKHFKGGGTSHLGKKPSIPRSSSTKSTKLKTGRKTKTKLKTGRGISTALYGGGSIPSLSVFGVRKD